MSIAQAPQGDPAGMAVVGSIPVYSWIGLDDRGVHHDARQGTGEPQTLPLPPRQPRRQTLIAGPAEHVHLLWLDADEDGVVQLFNALLRVPTLEVERGPTQVSDGQVLDYTAAEDASGGVFIGYSGGAPSEPSLTLTGIDTQGRPLQVLDHVRSVEKPTFLWVDETLRLFWMDRQRGSIMGGLVQAGRVRDVAPLIPTPTLAEGDRLINLRAGADEVTLYLFWNVERAAGMYQTAYTYSALGRNAWSPWAALGSQTAERIQVAPFNVGNILPAPAGGASLVLSAPLTRDAAILPVAGLREDVLTVFYLQAGDVVGEQSLRTGVRLLQPPLLVSDASRHLWLSWSENDGDGTARLYALSSTSRR